MPRSLGLVGTPHDARSTRTPDGVPHARRRWYVRSLGEEHGTGRSRRCSATTLAIMLLIDIVTVAVGALLTRLTGLAAVEFLVIAIVALGVRGGYRPRFNLRLADDLPRLLQAPALSVVVVVLTGLSPVPSPISMAHTLVLAAAPVAGGRAISYAVIVFLRKRRILASRAVVVGSGNVASHLVRILREHPEYGVVPVAILDMQRTARRSPSVLGAYALDKVVSDLAVTRLIIAYGALQDVDLVDVLRRCERLPATVHFVPRFFELGSLQVPSRVDDVSGFPLVRLRVGARRRLARRAKRLFDVAAALLLLVLTGPVLVAAAVAVKLSSPGPVIFKQTRIGENGRSIQILKFRTLLCNSDSDSTWCVTQDDRLTGVGRFLRRTGVDELPQIINVVRGEMSLVGPRPERPYFAGRFAAEIPRYTDRQRVPQGITGWAQVHGLRGDTPIPDRVRLDNYYIENWTFWWDLLILARTVLAVVGMRGG